MSGTKISDYDIGTAKWSEMLATMEKQRKGFVALSLTNFENSSLPAIAAGSYLEISGALYGFTSEEAVGGTPSSGQINYIYIDPTPITAAWSTIAPTWSDAKQGWYDATVIKRCVGGCYYSGTSYSPKGLLRGRKLWTFEYYSPSIIGVTESGSTLVWAAKHVNTPSDANTHQGFILTNLPNEAVVTSLKIWVSLPNSNDMCKVDLLRCPLSSNTPLGELGSITVYYGSSSGEDTTILNNPIDNSAYKYYLSVYFASTAVGIKYLYGIAVKYLAKSE